jgi:hypothetical protein
LGLTDTIKRTTPELAEGAGRAVVHLRSSRKLKEELALAISAADRVSQGLLCVLLCLEPCQPTQWQGRRVRALAPQSAADSDLLAAEARSEFAIHGFRNHNCGCCSATRRRAIPPRRNGKPLGSPASCACSAVMASSEKSQPPTATN